MPSVGLCLLVVTGARRLVRTFQHRVRTYIHAVAFEHSVLRVREINALEKVVFYIAVYGPYKP